jgi:opine dehydrogenase
VVLGGDCASLVVAGRLALAGHRVLVWEAPLASGSILKPDERQKLTLLGMGGGAEAELASTSDLFAALAAGEVLVTCAQPSTQAAFADMVLPLIEPRHVLVLLPGRLGSLAFAKWLRDRGRQDLPTLVESDVAPFAGRLLTPGRLDVFAVAQRPGFGVYPASRTEPAMALLADLFPDARAHPHVLAAALASVEPFVRAPALLMNAAAADRAGPDWAFPHGFTTGVARVAEALDGERLTLAAALGLTLPTAAEALHGWGLSPRGDLWSAVHGSLALTRAAEQSTPAELAVDDVAFGLRVWVALADQLGVPLPVCRSLSTLFAAASEVQLDSGRTLDDLGIAGLSVAGLDRLLVQGSDERTP